MGDVSECIDSCQVDGKHREAIVRVIAKMYLDNNRAPEEICHKFWIEFGRGIAGKIIFSREYHLLQEVY